MRLKFTDTKGQEQIIDLVALMGASGNALEIDTNGSLHATQISAAGTAVTDSGPIYEDETYRYYGATTAGRGLELTAAIWQVSRVHKTTGSEEYLDAGEFTQIYTDVTTVAGLWA